MGDKSHEDGMALADGRTVHTSEDHGASWAVVGLGETLTYLNSLSIKLKTLISSMGAFFRALLSIRGDSVTDIAWPETSRLYVATEDGDIYISVDMGVSFDKVTIGIVDDDISMIVGGEPI